MQNTDYSVGRFGRHLLFLVLTVLVSSACGLGLDTDARLERAETALADGEYRAAIIDAKNILQDEPGNLAARLVLGRASVEIGDGASAEKEFRRALELGAGIDTVLVDLGRALLLQREFDSVMDEIDPALASSEPNKLAVMRIRGDALIGNGNAEAGRDIFTAVLNADPQDVAAFHGVAKTYIVERNYIQAREVLRNALELDEEYIPAWLTSGDLALSTGDLSRALSDYSRAAQLAQKVGDRFQETEALAGQANTVLGEQNFDAARVTLDRMQLIAPQDPRTRLISARIAAADKDWDKAQEDLQEVLRRAPNQRQAQMLLGYVQKESGNLSQAEMYLSAVVNAVPDNDAARRLLAEIRLMMNKAVQAREALEPLTSQETPGVEALSMAAAASLSLDEFEEATNFLERSVEAAPDNVPLKIQLALAYYRAGEPAKARATLEAISADDIGNNEFQRDSLLVLSKIAQGERDVALDEVRSLRDRMPELADAHTLAGAIELSVGEFEAARTSLDKANQLRPNDVQTIRYLAQLDELEDEPESAKERYEQILQLQRDDIGAMVSLAKFAARSEDHVAAREWLQNARKSDSRAVAPRRILGSLLLAFREFAAAEDVLAEALALSSDDAQLNALMGHAMASQRMPREAEFRFGRAVELDPDDPSHRHNLARAQAALGNKSSAISTLRDGGEQTMAHRPSVIQLAALLAETGDLDEAKRIAARIFGEKPNTAAGYALDGELELRAGNFARAARAYDQAQAIENISAYAVRGYEVRKQGGLEDDAAPLVSYLEERPLDTAIRLLLAVTYEARGELNQANSEYERILTNDPDNFVAANNLAWNYYKQGAPGAEEAARKAYAIEPNSGEVADTLGWILVEKGSVEEGIQILSKAVDLSQNNPDIRYHLAAALAVDGQVGSAKDLLDEILGSAQEFESREAAEKLLETL
jgi:putative PEP-CTERM system TPR-repeat lipoprotein